MFVLDSHCDTPSQIYRLRDLSIDNDHAHVDFPKLQRGGVDGIFFALYTSNSLTEEEGWKYANDMLDGVLDTLRRNEGTARLTVDADEALRNQAEGLVSVFLGLENGSPVGKDISRLEILFNKGIRYITLTHAGNNEICDSCSARSPRWGGLSPFGREVLARMNELGIMADVSHISDRAFYDVVQSSSKPVIASHSCCRALAAHRRNMTDGMIRTLADAGGVLQINFYPVFLDDAFSRVLEQSGLEGEADRAEAEFIADPGNAGKRKSWYDMLDKLAALDRPSYRRIVDHIDHAVSVGGIEHVGLGSDFDGIPVTPEGLENCSFFPRIFEEMRRRGYREDDISKVAGGNFLRVLRDNK